MIYVYKDRIINVEWTVLKGTSTVKENFDRALVKLFLIGPHEKFLLKANAKDGIVSAEVPQGLPEGVYSVEIIYIKNWLGVDRPPKMPDRFPIDCRGNDRCIMRSRKDNLFAITEYESEATEIGEGEVVIRVKTSTASYGYDGLSAYEIAVLRGDFEGTEGEWLEWTHERIVSDVKDLLDKLKSRDTRFVVKTQSQRDNLKDLREGDEVYVIDDGIAYILETENGKRTWKPCDYGTVTSKYILSLIAGMPGFVADRAIADEFGKRIVDEYLTRDAVRNYMNEVFNDLFINNPPTIMDGMITVDMLSDAVKQLIGFGPIVNFPDDEFLTTKGGRITPKDRNYDPNNYSGMGRKILRKNMVNGVNVLTQKMMSCPNTVYVITYDYSLRGQTITVPENCVLQFEGGSLKNGTLIGDNTVIEANFNTVIFDTTITIAGTWNIKHIYDSWFAFNPASTFISNQIISNILALSNDNVYNTIHFESDRTYYFELPYKGETNLGDEVRPDYWKLNTLDYAFPRIFTGFTSNTHLIVNNTIQMLPTNQGAYFIFHIENKENITISGTGAINGDAKDHLYTDPFAGTDYYGEWGHVLNFRSCNNVVVRDITIGYAFGDGIALGNAAYNNNGVKEAGLATKNVTIDAVKVLYARRNGISLGGNNYTITNVYFEGNGSDTIKGTAPMAAIDFENDYVDIEPSGLCTNVSMNNCKFKDNKYDVSSTIRDDLYEVPRGELVNISDCNFTSPLRLNRTNGLTFSNCHIVGITNVDNSIAAWYVSKDLVFNNCVFDELNPYLAISAEEQNKKFINPTYPEDIKYSTTFQHSLPVGKALKFTIPKPLVGEVEFTAFCSNPNYGNIQMPVNTTIYTFGPSQRLTGIRDIKIKASQDSTPRYSMYKSTPVFSYINYTEDSNNFIIYFAIGGDLIGDSYASATSVNIFLTSKTKFITVEAPVSGRPDYAGMYGGKWSELSAIIKESVEISSIPSTVTFPSKEMYSGNMLADLPTSLTADKVGFSQFVLDGTYKRPVFWDSYSNVFRTADGNKALERRVTSLVELDALTAKLTTEDRGYVVYYTVTTSYITWRGTDWMNEDGSLFSKVKYIKQANTIDILNIMFSYSNVIYRICADVDLDGGTLTIASGSTLDFQGGSFSNGTIVGNGTTILPYGYKIQNASLKGSFKYPDGINAVNSDGICLNNVYDVLDAKNLAKETISNYQLVDSDYSILPQFRNIRSVRLATGAFAGFPTSVVHNDVLYCFYYQAASHTSTPGVHENLHYKYSSDNGDTWSDEKELVLPVSDSSGMFRSYRAAYAIPFNSNVLLGVFVTTSDSSDTKGSFTMLFEVSIDSSNNISIVNQIKVPILNNGSLVNSYQDNTITDSMIIGGNIIKVGSSYLFSCYTSSKANYIFSFDGDFTNNTHITTFDIIPYNGMVYTEHAFIKFSDTNFYIVFREDARRENTPIFKYNTSTSKFELFAVIDDVAYDGLDAVLVNDNTAVIMGRDWKNYYTPCRFALMNDSGKVYIDNAKYYGDVLGRDCGYCSLQVINNKLVVLFYIKTSAVNYDYNVVETEINVNKLVNLMYY